MSSVIWQQFGLVAVLFGVAFSVGYLRPQRKRSALSLPPGPRPLPIVGNVWGIDTSSPWLTYAKWASIYGDLVYSSFFNQEIVVINSVKVAKALLDRRSRIYSDRPEIPTNALFGVDFNTVLMHYGERWRRQRRLFHQAFRAGAAPIYRPMQRRKSRQLLLALFEDPDACFEHLHTYSSSIIMSAVYNYETKPKDDPMVNVVGRAMKLAVEEVRPEVAAFFSVFPFLLSLPAWVPGMGIRKKAMQSREWCKEWVDTPFEDVLERMKKGTAGRSMVSDALNKIRDEDPEKEHLLQAIKEASATAFGAASETTASTLQVFILAMVLFPDVQKKAQRVIDDTVGTSRLPLWTDRPSLKYIDAVLRETLRWNPILPLSTPHATTDSDEYESYYIPKGTTVMPNVWAMTHDETTYPNSFDFDPGRFLDEDGNLIQDAVDYAFGFGRRKCAGQYIADASLWYAISGMLALFSFSRAKDTNGNEIDVDPKWSSGIAIHPLPFPFRTTPRRAGMTTEGLHSSILFPSSY